MMYATYILEKAQKFTKDENKKKC